MSSDVKNDRAALSVFLDHESAERDARGIAADKVRTVTLMRNFGSGNPVTVGYLNVASGHACPCCHQHVPPEAL